MSEQAEFEPKIVAYVCNWCTYLGADLAGTNRLECLYCLPISGVGISDLSSGIMSHSIRVGS